MGVTLTDTAAKHVANFLTKRGKGIGLRLGVRVERRIGKQLVGQGLQAGFAGNHAFGAALGLEGQIQVFQFLFGGCGVDDD